MYGILCVCCIYRVWQVPHKTRGASAAAARAAERVAMEEQRRNQSYQLLSDSEEEEVVPAKVSVQGRIQGSLLGR